MKIKLVFLFILYSLSVNSQILNFERFRPNIDTAKVLSLSLAIGVDLKNKITTSTEIHSELGTYYLSEHHAYYFLGDFRITRVNNDNIFEQGHLHIRSVFNRTKRIAYETFVQYQYDLGKGLEKRNLLGGNLRGNLIKKNDLTLSLGTGVFYENENWRRQEETENITIPNVNLKSNNYISTQWFINNIARLVLTGYYQATFDNFINGRVILDSNLHMKFTKKLAYNVRFELSSDSAPIVETGRLVYLLSTGFRYSF